MDKLSEHAIRMLEIADKPYCNEYGMINKDLQDKHDIARAIYDLILQVQMLKEVNRKLNCSEKPNNCETCKHDGRWENEYEYGYPSPCTVCVHRALSHYEPKDEPQPQSLLEGYFKMMNELKEEVTQTETQKSNLTFEKVGEREGE